jgi:hypothetical protein
MSKFRANPWAVLLVVSLGYFMTLLEITTICAQTQISNEGLITA